LNWISSDIYRLIAFQYHWGDGNHLDDLDSSPDEKVTAAVMPYEEGMLIQLDCYQLETCMSGNPDEVGMMVGEVTQLQVSLFGMKYGQTVQMSNGRWIMAHDAE
jgi:hypothetical protein